MTENLIRYKLSTSGPDIFKIMDWFSSVLREGKVSWKLKDFEKITKTD